MVKQALALACGRAPKRRRAGYILLGTKENARMRWISAEFIPVRARNANKREKLLPTGDTRCESPRRFAAPQSDGSVSVSQEAKTSRLTQSQV